MLRLTQILGAVTDPELSEALHELSHANGIETITLSPEDAVRKRIRATTDQGLDCAIMLRRDQRLHDGAVLLLEKNRAIVVRLTETRWIPFTPADLRSALELGQSAGNAHWRIRIDGETLHVAVEGPEEHYTRRVQALVDAGRVRLAEDSE